MARVGQLCNRINQRVAEIPDYVGPGGLRRYDAQEIAVEGPAVASLAAVRAPAPMATAYGQFIRLSARIVTDLRQAQAATAAHEQIKNRRLRLDAFNATEGASLVALGLGLGYCAYDVEPERFIGRSASEWLTAKLDQACAPAVSADEDSKLDEVFAGEQRRAGKITPRALLQQVAIAFDNAGQSSRSTVQAIARLRAPAGLRASLHDLVAQLQQSTALFVNTAAALNDARPVDLPEVARALEQFAHRAGLDAARFQAFECEAL